MTRQIPGFEVKVLDDDGKPCEAEAGEGPDKPGQSAIGKMALKRPLPPGSLIDVVGAAKDDALKGYFEVPEYFCPGDSGRIDENGYLKVVGRTDDIITLKDGEKVPT